MNTPQWQWDEIQQVGTDYSDLAQVEAYDNRMGSFRDVAAENRHILDMLGLPAGSRILEIGCGTGQFARFAAKAAYTVTAVDVSPIMLEYLRKKATQENLPEIKTFHAGFLTMNFEDAHFDAVVSSAALHHLPDAWKYLALQKIAKVLKPGGQFILRDVVFTINAAEPATDCISRFVASFNEQVRPGAILHAKQEYSTYDWIMEGMLRRAGLAILSKKIERESFALYHCRKANGICDEIATPNSKPAYFLVQVQEVFDNETYMEYVRRVPAIIKEFGGTYLSRGAAAPLSDHAQPIRTILIEFPSEDHIKKWWSSPEYRKVAPLRERSAKAQAYILQSC